MIPLSVYILNYYINGIIREADKESVEFNFNTSTQKLLSENKSNYYQKLFRKTSTTMTIIINHTIQIMSKIPGIIKYGSLKIVNRKEFQRKYYHKIKSSQDKKK